MPEIGTVCFETTQGIAHLARDYYRQGVVTRVLVVRHRHYKYKLDVYPPEVRYTYPNQLDRFLAGLDILLLFETDLTPYWRCARQAKSQGIRLVLMPMYEYTPFPTPVQPDLVLCPSKLDLQYYSGRYNSVYLPVPVQQTWRLRERAIEFVHNAGHGQWDYAKGTVQLLEAMRYVTSPIRLRIRYLPDAPRMRELHLRYSGSPSVSWERGELPPDKLYFDGDIFINAEKFNGLSLPLQEAWASGMPVMTSNRFPANDWLPTTLLIPVERYEPCRIPGGSGITFEKAVINPKDIAACIDRIYAQDISQLSLNGKRYAEENSWERLKPLYLKAMQQLL